MIQVEQLEEQMLHVVALEGRKYPLEHRVQVVGVAVSHISQLATLQHMFAGVSNKGRVQVVQLVDIDLLEAIIGQSTFHSN